MRHNVAIMMRLFLLLALPLAILAQPDSFPTDPASIDVGKGMFRIYCAPCHGIRAQGGRGPDLSRGVFRSGDTDAGLFRTISTGVPGTEMPGWAQLGDENLRRMVAYIRSVNRHDNAAVTGDAAHGESLFWAKGACGNCHMVGGRGRSIGPDLSRVGRRRSLAYLRESILSPNADITPGYNSIVVVTRAGKKITGVERSFDNFSARLVDLSGEVRSFQKDSVASLRREYRSLMPDSYGSLFTGPELQDLLAYLAHLDGASAARIPAPAKSAIPPESDPNSWVTYGRNSAGWRYSPLDQISTANVARLAPAWVLQTGTGDNETTPLVYGGVMYLTGISNHAWAVDARTGQRLWSYSKIPPKGIGLCCGEVNRGFSAIGNRLFKVNIEDTLVALDSQTGAVLWESLIGDYKKGYSGTLAPLAVKNKVLVGTAGAEFGIRGFVDAYDASTGERAWRFYTVAGKGEPGGETWNGDTWQRGGGSTWITGTYDPELNLTYWGTGNPGPDMNGDIRPGDNLYTCSVVALDADTGQLKWHFQFTPHDVHDWDAISDPVLVDLTIGGKKVKALIQANRNGFFYALDRTNGKMLLAKPYTKVSWADGIAPDGRPKLIAGQDPSEEGTKACPGLGGGHNWQATAYSPQTGLYYFGTTDGCHIYYKTTQDYLEGQWFQLSTVDSVRQEPESGAVVALDPAAGVTKWRYEMVNSPSGGMLATAGGLVFTGDGFGYLIALDARTGKVAWKFQTGGPVVAPPVTYALDGKQYIAVTAGGALLTFALR
jgi:alcohol dehydrogenase (cytochrome c)